jgi:hypothetical protein
MNADNAIALLDSKDKSEKIEALGKLLHSLSSTKFCESFRKAGGIRLLLKTSHKSFDTETEELVCGCLMNLSCVESCRVPILKEGGMEQLIQYVQQYKEEDRQKLSQYAARSLNNMLVEEEYRRYLVTNNGVEPIIEMLRICDEDDMIMRKACLSCLSALSDEKNAEDMIHKYNILPLIIANIDACLNVDTKDVTPLLDCCHITFNLSLIANNDMCDDTDLCEAFLMLLHHDNLQIVNSAALILSVFATDPEGAQLIRSQNDSINTIKRVLQTYTKKKADDTVERALVLLLNMCNSDETTRVYVCEEGIVPVLLDIMNSKSKKLVEKSIIVLARLAMHDKNAELFCSEKSMPVVVAMMTCLEKSDR